MQNLTLHVHIGLQICLRGPARCEVLGRHCGERLDQVVVLLINGERLIVFSLRTPGVLEETVDGFVKRDSLLVVFNPWQLHRVGLNLAILVSLLQLSKLFSTLLRFVIALVLLLLLEDYAIIL